MENKLEMGTTSRDNPNSSAKKERKKKRKERKNQ
jgi:hypothetical protein